MSETTGEVSIPAQGTPAAGGPWADYLAAAQRLDAVRRAASAATTEHAAAVQAAQQELAGVRARLAPQRARLIRDFGVPEIDLTPQPADEALALPAVAGGPAAVLIVQIVLYLVAPAGSVPTYALLCGLSMPLLAFGLGWVTIGFVYGGGPEKVDRTPLIGVITCLMPVLLTCMGVGLLQFLD